VREAPPSLPPVVWALAVYNTFSIFVMVGSFTYFESAVFLSEELVGCACFMTLFDLQDDLNDDRCADWQTLNAVYRPHMTVFGAEELNEQI
jgi:hypothetical protein